MLVSSQINKLFREITKEYISTLSYEGIRQHCLKHEPIPEILEKFKQQLDELVKEEKKEVASKLLRESYVKQVKEDEEEASVDAKKFTQLTSSKQTLENAPKDVENASTERMTLELANIENQFNELKQRASTRQERAEASKANLTSAMINDGTPPNDLSIQAQLSPKNYQLLIQKINKEQKEINNSQQYFLSLAYNGCYEGFLYSLNEHLKQPPTNSHLTAAQCKALEKIVRHMENYLRATKELQNEEKNIDNLTTLKRQLENKLIAKEWNQSNLITEKKQLEENKKTLENQQKEIEELLANNAKRIPQFIKAGAFSLLFSGGYYAAAVLAIKLLMIATPLIPFILIPAGIASLVSLGLLLTAAIYKRSYSQENENLENNKRLIESMTTQIESKEKELVAVDEHILTLSKRVGDLETVISNIEKAAQELQYAEQVSVTGDHSQRFMPPPKTLKPSSEEDQLHADVGNNNTPK